MKPSSYKSNRAFADSYLPEVIEILKRNAMHIVTIRVAPEEQDIQQATDMLIEVTGGSVAVRVRRPYKNIRDLTIRSRIRYGGITELAKLRAGYGDWYLYCWTGENEKIAEWILVDINKMRSSRILDEPRPEISNRDGTFFVAIPTSELCANDCIVACA